MIKTVVYEQALFETIKRGATEISPDVHRAFVNAIEKESNLDAKKGLAATLKSMEMSAVRENPLCVDTGWPIQINRFMNSLYKTYVANGIPVVIGEFGARDKGGNLLSRVTYAAYYAANASARNMPCVWWDNNGHTGSGELFALLNRKECSWAYPEIVEALVQYGGYEKIPEKK